jgi:hypothetical protein
MRFEEATPAAPAGGRRQQHRRFRPACCRRWAPADTRAHYRVRRGVIDTPAAQATVHAQGGHARGA